MRGRYSFGRRSEAELATLDADLRRVLRHALERGVIDFGVIEGHREQWAQDEAFRTGKSKLRWPNGRHNAKPSEAADLAPWIRGSIPWDDPRPWYLLAGVILSAAAELGVDLRWGGDWDGDTDLADQSFNDLGHFERLRA